MGPVTPAMLMTAWKLTRLHSLPRVTQLILLVRSRTCIYTVVWYQKFVLLATTVYFHAMRRHRTLIKSGFHTIRTQIYSMTFWNVTQRKKEKLEGSGQYKSSVLATPTIPTHEEGPSFFPRCTYDIRCISKVEEIQTRAVALLECQVDSLCAWRKTQWFSHLGIHNLSCFQPSKIWPLRGPPR